MFNDTKTSTQATNNHPTYIKESIIFDDSFWQQICQNMEKTGGHFIEPHEKLPCPLRIFEHGMMKGRGTFYFNQRWYDPEIGRFLTEDPAGQHMNPYMYCRNNPLTHLDPTGLKDWSWDDIAKTFEMATRVVSTGINMANGQDFNEAWTNSDTAAQIGKGVGEVFTGVVQTGISMHVGQGLFGGVNFGSDFIGTTLTHGVREGGARVVDGMVSGDHMSLANTFDKFGTGLLRGGTSGALTWGYKELVGFNPTLKSGKGYINKIAGQNPAAGAGVNNILFERGKKFNSFFPDEWLWEDGPISRGLNMIPGMNSFAGLHDTWAKPDWARTPGGTLATGALGLIMNYGVFTTNYYYGEYLGF